ncbi:hypothetical protein A3A79_01405 [Candidatus Gottesmanbacteria bacterium RIFCSPLOWO2_01_FULL_43_11b]|uniref:Uncharacterized protein n=1 Tax=Candidatus Gottesmanbacteria bacterium RIFCSPLOWO2_01_FULL_43_11b TaxID=1798392 RepID=A0A1F6AHG6_9BACT|nr:MAG: hypothetical protein A3A79_01405 [Candidatus Gottesmanbacteria bacterium RIFCSPLOWO2_01_FULL_43_11b]
MVTEGKTLRKQYRGVVRCIEEGVLQGKAWCDYGLKVEERASPYELFFIPENELSIDFIGTTVTVLGIENDGVIDAFEITKIASGSAN